ncbi:xanthine dehydrogenase family protein molybdopterin-binding subunit [Fertoebacter nigrum]|uniref:Xanthine dehydrogenase family protein molybdopterin-binding subunit n=1 Tax=Fertoeibacter niger TaxID=2656921 RepID=A0A8X8H2B2_9RHOB|nr:xanthine dehydrogenase family protein molybdopterin-binding subunit [Fertoeibacter niger]NUB45971.1 xanthine dehydrogenase family protein molybdopterin-binding subunit [Fertoeibacter niger]
MNLKTPFPDPVFARRDAFDKLRGRTRYTVDEACQGHLQAYLLRADVASGEILRLDVSAARKMPGVRAVVTASDAPHRFGIGVADQRLFATGRVRYKGEPLAAIAADTLEQAKAAALAVDVVIRPLPAVFDMAGALASGAPLVHPDWATHEVLLETRGAGRGGNLAWESQVRRGDVDAAFSRPDVTIVESAFRVGRQIHMQLEPRAAIASYADGRLHLIASTQAPWTVKNVTARALGLSPARVRVTAPAVGGGFGAKYGCTIEPYAAALALACGKSVALVPSRAEEMLSCPCRENADILIRSAVTRDGRIAGREAVVLMDCGAYGGEQIYLTTMTAHTLGSSYRLEAVRLVSRAVYTNTAPNGAFRACNGVYNIFALESHTDEICQAIGMDPVEFRRRNVLGDGDLGSTGQVFQGDVLGPMLEKMSQMRSKGATLPSDDGRLYGRATTVGTWFVFVGPSAATVNLNPDGSATLVTAGVEIGQGTMMQSLPQIVAAELGLSPCDVVVHQADTDAAGFDVGVGGGRTTVSLGAAAVAACTEIRQKLLALAARLLQAPASELSLSQGRIDRVGHPGTGMTLASLAQEAMQITGPISGSGAFTRPGVAAMDGCAAGHFLEAVDIPVFAVHDCDVAVDPATGQVEVLRYRVVQDVGRALNPSAIHGQIQGGVVQGLGYALHEEVTLAEDGAFRQAGFGSYRIPLAQDVVPVEIELHEGAPSIGPWGAKGAGEVPILNVGAAIACAVSRAIGVRVQELPLTPPHVLALLQGRKPALQLHHPQDWPARPGTNPPHSTAAVSVAG